MLRGNMEWHYNNQKNTIPVFPVQLQFSRYNYVVELRKGELFDPGEKTCSHSETYSEE